jgi:hypothetical protein
MASTNGSGLKEFPASFLEGAMNNALKFLNWIQFVFNFFTFFIYLQTHEFMVMKLV